VLLATAGRGVLMLGQDRRPSERARGEEGPIDAVTSLVKDAAMLSGTAIEL